MPSRLNRLLAALAVAAWALSPILAAPAAAQADPARAAEAALDWMRGQQQPDGAFPGFGPGDTADAVLAFAAAGADPAALSNGGKTAAEFLQAQGDYARGSVGAAAKLALAAVALGADPTSFGGLNLLELIGQAYDPATGQYGADVFGHGLALLAISAAGAQPPAAAVQRLIGLQLPDGGWSFDGTAATGSDTNTTGVALQALAGSPAADEARAKALAYLRTQQNADGGFPYSQASQFGTDSDANSTASAILGIIAAGEDPSSWKSKGGDPLQALVGLQNASGALRFQAAAADDNGLATYQAVPALLGRALPVATAQVAGAAALVAPAAAPLPATGAPAGDILAPLAALAVALLAAGLWLRRRGA